jgi:hypothetical protein
MPEKGFCQLAGLIATIAVAAIASTASVYADDSVPAPVTHIRTTSPELRSLVDDSMERSSTFRALVGQIDASNVIVYLAHTLFKPAGPDGRLVFMGTAGGRRYVLIQIACLHTRVDEFAILGHEIQHAAEVAAAPSIVDSASLARHYQTIGFIARQWQHGVAFETRAATDSGAQVQREVLDAFHAEEAAARAAAHAPAAATRN